MESVKDKIKINYTIEVRVSANNEDELWLTLDTHPWMQVNFGSIPFEARRHLQVDDLLVMTLDMEPRNGTRLTFG